jgi:hypothetical protein
MVGRWNHGAHKTGIYQKNGCCRCDVRAVGAAATDAAQARHNITLPTPRFKALMEMFGLKYPIFQAPPGPATSLELAIAVSNAGAMGALAFLGSPELAREAVSKVRSATKGYFVVNFILQFEPTALQTALDAGAPVVQFSWGIPTREMIPALRAAKAKLGMQGTCAESARAALDMGADYLARALRPVAMCKQPEGCMRHCHLFLRKPAKSPWLLRAGSTTHKEFTKRYPLAPRRRPSVRGLLPPLRVTLIRSTSARSSRLTPKILH